MIKLFLGIFIRLKRFLRNNFNMYFCPRTVADRPGRPTARVDRTKGRSTVRSTDVHKLCTSGSLVGRSTGRSTVTESNALCSFRSTVRSTGLPNGHIYDRWRSIGRSTARPVRLPDQPNG